MSTKIRRIVTGHDANGKAVAVMDDIAPNAKSRMAGLTATLLWRTFETPAGYRNEDTAVGDVPVSPPEGGSVFRIVEFPPLDEAAIARMAPDQTAREIGAHSAGTAQRHPFTHRTDSVDYAIVMSGEIDMLLDEDDIHCKAGDVIIQQGTNHAWVNRGTEPCLIAFVLIDGEKLG